MSDARRRNASVSICITSLMIGASSPPGPASASPPVTEYPSTAERGFFFGVIKLAEVVLDVLLRDADQVQLAADHVGQSVQRLEIQRIGDRDGQRQPLVENRDDAVALGDFLRDGFGDSRIKDVIRKTDEWNARVGGQGFRHRLLGERGVRQKMLDDRFASRERAPAPDRLLRRSPFRLR